jgi:hypothetical protein
VAAKAWCDEARRYQEITAEAEGAAQRAWDRGDYRGCEVAIRTAEDALRWCESCAAFAEAWETVAWAAVTEDCQGIANFAAAGEAAEDARAIVESCREAAAGCHKVRRLTRTVADCEADTVCAGAVDAG